MPRQVSSIHGVEERDDYNQPSPVQPEILETSTKAPPKPPKEKVVEVKPSKPSRGGCGCSCKQLGCLFLIGVLILIGLLIVTIVRRPPVLWEPFKTLVNASAQPDKQKESVNLNDVASKVQSQLFSQAGLTLTQDEVAWLVQTRVEKEVQANITPELLHIFINLDEGKPQPLWLIVDVKVNAQKQPYVSRIGTGLISAPGFLTDSINNLLQKFLLGDSSDTIVNSVINAIGKVNIKEVQLQEGKLTIITKLDLNNNITP